MQRRNRACVWGLGVAAATSSGCMCCRVHVLIVSAWSRHSDGGALAYVEWNLGPTGVYLSHPWVACAASVLAVCVPDRVCSYKNDYTERGACWAESLGRRSTSAPHLP